MHGNKEKTKIFSMEITELRSNILYAFQEEYYLKSELHLM